MPDPNVLDPRWDAELLDAPFHLRAARVGAHAGATELGATLYELEPGGRVSLLHLHHGNEELLIVLSGTPELRTAGGIRSLEPGAVVAFPTGPDGAHAVRNPGPAPARVLLVSTMRFPDVAEHLDTGATLTITGPAEGRVFPGASDVPVGEALVAAMAADAEATAPGDAGSTPRP